MRRASPLLILALLAGCPPSDDAPPTPVSSASNEGWDRVWADEFDGAHLDTTAWTSEVMPDPFNEERQYYPGRIDVAPGSNAWLEGGVLVIEARAEVYEHLRYTSASTVRQPATSDALMTRAERLSSASR